MKKIKKRPACPAFCGEGSEKIIIAFANLRDGVFILRGVAKTWHLFWNATP